MKRRTVGLRCGHPLLAFDDEAADKMRGALVYCDFCEGPSRVEGDVLLEKFPKSKGRRKAKMPKKAAS